MGFTVVGEDGKARRFETKEAYAQFLKEEEEKKSFGDRVADRKAELKIELEEATIALEKIEKEIADRAKATVKGAKDFVVDAATTGVAAGEIIGEGVANAAKGAKDFAVNTGKEVATGAKNVAKGATKVAEGAVLTGVAGVALAGEGLMFAGKHAIKGATTIAEIPLKAAKGTAEKALSKASKIKEEISNRISETKGKVVDTARGVATGAKNVAEGAKDFVVDAAVTGVAVGEMVGEGVANTAKGAKDFAVNTGKGVATGAKNVAEGAKDFVVDAAATGVAVGEMVGEGAANAAKGVKDFAGNTVKDVSEKAKDAKSRVESRANKTIASMARGAAGYAEKFASTLRNFALSREEKAQAQSKAEQSRQGQTNEKPEFSMEQ